MQKYRKQCLNFIKYGTVFICFSQKGLIVVTEVWECANRGLGMENAFQSHTAKQLQAVANKYPQGNKWKVMAPQNQGPFKSGLVGQQWFGSVKIGDCRGPGAGRKAF